MQGNLLLFNTHINEVVIVVVVDIIIVIKISTRFPNRIMTRIKRLRFARIPFLFHLLHRTVPSLARILWKCNIPSLISRRGRSEKSIAGKNAWNKCQDADTTRRQRFVEIRLLSSFNFWRRLYQDGNLVNVILFLGRSLLFFAPRHN